MTAVQGVPLSSTRLIGEYFMSRFSLISIIVLLFLTACSKEKTVDSIVRWTEPMPMEGYTRTEVTYTYKIVNLALWAERPDVQHAFGDIRTTLNGVSKANQDAGLQLTNQGWEVSGQ